MPLGDLNQLLRNCSPFNSTNNNNLSTNASNSTSSSTFKDETLLIPSCSNSSNSTKTNSSLDLPDDCLQTNSSAQNGSKFVNRLLVKDLIWISSQISAGMLFLQQHNCTHRDLATRNCLLDENLCVKVSDFGTYSFIFL